MDLSWLIPAVAVLAVLLLGAFLVSRFRIAKPEQALIVTGAKTQNEIKILRTGGVFVWPIIQRADYLSLQVYTFEVSTPEVYTTDGIPVIVEGVAQIKVKSDPESIAIAAEHFLGKQEDAMGQVAVQLLEGYLKTTIAQLTMDEVYKHREEFAAKVREFVASDLGKMGLQMVAFMIKDVKDKMGYLDAIGLPRIATLKRDAEIAKAIAQRDEQIAKSKALEESQKAEFLAETNIAEAAKEMEVKKTQFLLEQETRKAEAEKAIRLQELKMMHELKEEEMATQLLEKKMLNELEAQELERRERHAASLKKMGIKVDEEPEPESETRVEAKVEAKVEEKAEANVDKDAVKKQKERNK